MTGCWITDFAQLSEFTKFVLEPIMQQDGGQDREKAGIEICRVYSRVAMLYGYTLDYL